MLLREKKKNGDNPYKTFLYPGKEKIQSHINFPLGLPCCWAYRSSYIANQDIQCWIIKSSLILQMTKLIRSNIR